MTIKEIKNELERLKAQAKQSMLDHNSEQAENVLTGINEALDKSLSLLNQLSAPELVWKENLLGSYAEALSIDEKRTLTYAIGTDRDNFFVLINGELETLDPLKSEDEARKFAQAHWNKLYNQIINL